MCGQAGSKSKTHSVLTHVGETISADWRSAAPTSGLRAVTGKHKPKPEPEPELNTHNRIAIHEQEWSHKVGHMSDALFAPMCRCL
jgi:hypothetical protein